MLMRVSNIMAVVFFKMITNGRKILITKLNRNILVIVYVLIVIPSKILHPHVYAINNLA